MRTLLLVNSLLLGKKRSLALPVAVSFAALCSLSSCATSDKNTIHWQQDRNLVVNSLQELRSSEANLEGQLTQINQRILELQKNIQMQQGQLGALEARLKDQNQQLQKFEQQLQSTASTSTSPVTAARKTSNKNTKPNNANKQTRSTAQTLHPETTTHLVRSINAKPTDPPRRATTEEEKNSYTAAYLAYKSERFQDAVQSFQQLLGQYPDGEYADPSYYWLAESFLAQKEYTKALETFSFYTTHYPKSGKLAAAMLGTARAHLALQDKPSATAVLQQLKARFPDSTAAERGKKLLAASTALTDKP